VDTNVRVTELNGARSAIGSPVSRSLLRYYLHDGADAFRFELIGTLSAIDLSELDGCWRTARSSVAGRKLRLDIRQLRDVDEAGRQWLTEMITERAECVVSCGFSEGLAQELGLPAMRCGSNAPRQSLTWLRRWLGASPSKPCQKPKFNPGNSPVPLTGCDG
jgi:hypothetical protein